MAALLVSHNGQRWLPDVLAAIERSTARPAALVATDTGSRDDSVQLVREAGWDVERLGADASYAEAVSSGLARAGDSEWIWLLHDDCAPEPDALEHLLAAAEEWPEAAALGPKLREWPSLRRLLEVGVTISGTGRRETGLERGEYDQGQHDDHRAVLAVNTAGMLVRREVLTEIGLDPQIPVIGTDLDFGWRVARAGHASVVVPEAVVFHVEASERAVRDTRRSHPHREARAGAIRTLMANGPGRGLPLKALLLAVGSLLRAVGFLLVRSPRESWDEVVAAAGELRPGRVRAARRERERTARLPHTDVVPLLAPRWLPLRHLLDSVGGFGTALVDIAREVVAGREVRTAHTVDLEDEGAATEPGLLGLLVRNPRFWLVLGSVVLAVVAWRAVLAGGYLQGGALLPVPDRVGHWWSTWSASTHLLGAGTAAPGPSYLLPLALAGTVLLGQTGWVVWLLFVLGVPLAALSALRFLRRIVPGRVAPLWGAVAYALLPVAAGATGQGRLGTVAAAVLLPWVATSALRLTAPDDDRRWRAVWRTTLGLGLLVAFVPPAWFLAVLLLGGLLVAGLTRDRARWRGHRWWGGPVVVAVVPLVLVLPWFLGTLGTPAAWLLEAGWTGYPAPDADTLGLLLGRAGGAGAAPVWLGAGTVVAGVLAGFRADTRPRVVAAWGVALLGAVLVAVWSHLSLALPGVDGDLRPYAGFFLLVVHAALVVAAVLAGDGLRARLGTTGKGPVELLRLPVAAVGVAAALVGIVGTAAWWVAGPGGPLERGPVEGVPSYMTQLAQADPASGVLVLEGGRRDGVTYRLLREGPLRVGDDGVVAVTEPDPRLTGVVSQLVGDPQPENARTLASYGVAYVYAPSPVSPAVSGSFDAATGFSRASSPRPVDAAWRLQDEPTLSAVDDSRAWWRPVLLALQVLAVVAVIVLATPTRASRRTR
ncbi:hypothetical protein GCM10011519_32930 [Marmoricola endophyticus]|uniref:Glycosyltransferase family 2 protein n=1 Tax=Marmoricola endophyticus TaxID=2040280 RepID=A0A917BTN4_9ACTN|nr:glycosyltransferase family 2 protein [Marmoricola endophyticus]GGF56374.1 hypothetical protein GCM10011519_32930 [Marmoricola endophyticus]